MSRDELYMKRCMELAMNGHGSVSPNPLVGAVIVHNDLIIGEGWHRKYGEAHAEVNAVASVANPELLHESTIYVNLEPCSHHGKTPPCADLIIKHKFKRVVVGMIDPYPEVAGKGIARIRQAGIEVSTGVLEDACTQLNKRFITYHLHKRPYVILKWAQSNDGLLAPHKHLLTETEFEQKRHLSGPVVQRLVHKWRGEEDAILVGTHTAEWDNPMLNTRAWPGRNPVRVILDAHLRLPHHLHIFDGSQRTFIIADHTNINAPGKHQGVTYLYIDFAKDISTQVLEVLYQQKISSLIIEGGNKTLSAFTETKTWDEAQIFHAPKSLGSGVPAPFVKGLQVRVSTIDGVRLEIIKQEKDLSV